MANSLAKLEVSEKDVRINENKAPEGSLPNIGLLKHIKVIKELFKMGLTLEMFLPALVKQRYAQGVLGPAFELR